MEDQNTVAQESVNLTKAAAINKLSESLGTTKVQAGIIYDTFMGVIKETLAEGGDVRIPGVGRIYGATVKPRDYKVPTTGEVVSKGERSTFRIASKVVALSA